ncbi:hypothetical protein D9613_004406 [Agrocybe pediades]|uniref:Uncharacterized protein n=1 Tax=Agrocybe pediades TaxID=84607 RepID=A0A8H4QJF2_9AGAR|nr:hypothetical protein D9613_004406 [Agrocybe pediades]
MTFERSESLEFQQHIHNLLYEYCKTHLTTDYVAFSENIVAEFVEDLEPVSLVDPYSFILPVDPFEVFSQKHSLSLLPPYEENAETTKEALSYLKGTMSALKGLPNTEKFSWSDSSYELLPEQFIPALTRTSRNKTPKLGKRANITPSLETLIKEQAYKTIDVEPVEQPKLQMEEILRVNHQIDEDEYPTVRSLLQKTADMLRPQKSYKNRYLDPSYLCNTDSIPVQKPATDLFTPIFPRTRLPGSGRDESFNPLPELKTYSDLPSKTPTVEVEDLDPSPSRLNLVIVDGWGKIETIQSSQPSTPSYRNSDSDEQVDQLEFPSSPDTDLPLVEEVQKSKLDEIIVPRSRQIGGNSGITPHILHKKTLNSFLQPLLSEPKDEALVHRPNSPSATSSMVGQPASELVTDGELDFNNEVKKIYEGQNLEDMIFNETMNEKQDMLMEVPALPSPNVHPPNQLQVARSLADYIIPPESMKGMTNVNAMFELLPLHRFLRKTKGISALSVQLSWTLFTVDEKLPSVDEIVGVSNLFDHWDLKDAGSIVLTEAEVLVKSVEDEDRIDPGLRYAWTTEDYGLYRPPAVVEETRILLTRQERIRLAKQEGRLVEESDDEEPVKEDDAQDNEDNGRIENGRPAKRAKLDDEQEMDGVEVFSGNHQDPTQAMRLAPLHWDNTEDIDVFWKDDTMAWDADEDKENWPPASSATMDESGVYHEIWESPIEEYPIQQPEGDQYVQESFEALSFDSRQPVKDGTQNWRAHDLEDLSLAPSYTGNRDGVTQLDAFNDFDAYVNLTPNRETLVPLVDSTFSFPNDLELASRTLGISNFAHLRSRKVSKPASPPPAPDPLEEDPIETFEEPRGVPLEIIDKNTLTLPETRSQPGSIHRYMASLDLIQKHGLVRALRSDDCAVELVERQDLGGADLIVDPYCAVIFPSVFSLPAKCESVVEKVAALSWKFTSVLVVFEGYPEHYRTRGRASASGAASARANASRSSGLYAYTPPIVKAIKRFRRDLDIADACGTKRPGSQVLCAFADNVDEAALLARLYGDRVEAQDDTAGAIWGERAWLGLDFLEEEEKCLAGINGMNHFTASIILSQISLQEFINLLPEERLEMECNADIEARFQAMAVSSEMSSVTN